MATTNKLNLTLLENSENFNISTLASNFTSIKNELTNNKFTNTVTELWANSSPTNAYTTGTVTTAGLDLTSYDRIEIYFICQKAQQCYQNIYINPTQFYGTTQMDWSVEFYSNIPGGKANSRITKRTFKITGAHSIQFDNAYYKTFFATATAAATASGDYLIPYKIYGYKNDVTSYTLCSKTDSNNFTLSDFTNSFTQVENNIKNIVTRKKLWSNTPNSTGAFTVSVPNLAQYDFVECITADNTSGDGSKQQTSVKFPVFQGSQGQVQATFNLSSDSNIHTMQRAFTCDLTNNKINVSTGYRITSTTTEGTMEAYMLPIKIYGYKFT